MSFRRQSDARRHAEQLSRTTGQRYIVVLMSTTRGHPWGVVRVERSAT
jgi:hypothetical protein